MQPIHVDSPVQKQSAMTVPYCCGKAECNANTAVNSACYSMTACIHRCGSIGCNTCLNWPKLVARGPAFWPHHSSMTLARLPTALARTAAALSEARWMSMAMQTWPHVAGGPFSTAAAAAHHTLHYTAMKCTTDFTTLQRMQPSAK